MNKWLLILSLCVVNAVVIVSCEAFDYPFEEEPDAPPHPFSEVDAEHEVAHFEERAPSIMGRSIRASSKAKKSKYKLPTWGDQEQLEAIISQRDQHWSTLINNVASAREPSQPTTKPSLSLQMVLRDLNQAMRDSYKGFMERVGKNLFPVIIASDYEPGFAGVGSTFKLILADGTTKHIAPTPGSYERNKALAHMPLALFTMVSAYFNIPTSPDWQPGVKQYQEKLKASLAAVKAAKPGDGKNEPSRAELERAKRMLDYAIDYTETILKKRKADQIDFMKFTAKMVPLLEVCMTEAAEAQVHHVYPALKEWKEEMGEAEWDKLYVLIPTVWPVAEINPRQQIFERLMKPDKIKTNILKIENAQSEDHMRGQMGRVIGDRTMAQMIWGVRTPSAIDHLLSLSTRRDLVSTACEFSLRNMLDGEQEEGPEGRRKG